MRSWSKLYIHQSQAEIKYGGPEKGRVIGGADIQQGRADPSQVRAIRPINL